MEAGFRRGDGHIVDCGLDDISRRGVADDLKSPLIIFIGCPPIGALAGCALGGPKSHVQGNAIDIEPRPISKDANFHIREGGGSSPGWSRI
jgi:hypothetical protein